VAVKFVAQCKTEIARKARIGEMITDSSDARRAERKDHDEGTGE
jgi:hypothetical protein